MVEIPRLQAKSRFVMPEKSGIHLRPRCKTKENLDSATGSGPGQALRRNDDNKMSRLLVDEFRTLRL